MKLTDKHIAALDQPMNTGDGSYCMLALDFTEEHIELEDAGLIQVSDLPDTEILVEITETGIRAVGKFNGTPEEDIQEAINWLNSLG